MEKVDDHDFLFGVEVGADRQHLVVRAVGVERNFLRALCWLEAARMMLRLWSLSGEGLEPRSEFDRGLKSFPILNAFNITFVCVLVRGADGDDPLGLGHLQLQVSVVGDRHELGVSRSSDDGVVSASKTHHFEVGCCAKIDW